MNPCSSYRPGEFTCRDGFIQTLPCFKDPGGCASCGEPRKRPWCMREDIPQRWLDEAGRPRFAGSEKP
jgi:hypothetical protein